MSSNLLKIIDKDRYYDPERAIQKILSKVKNQSVQEIHTALCELIDIRAKITSCLATIKAGILAATNPILAALELGEPISNLESSLQSYSNAIDSLTSQMPSGISISPHLLPDPNIPPDSFELSEEIVNLFIFFQPPFDHLTQDQKSAGMKKAMRYFDPEELRNLALHFSSKPIEDPFFDAFTQGEAKARLFRLYCLALGIQPSKKSR